MSFCTERREVKNLFNMPIIQEILRFAQNDNNQNDNKMTTKGLIMKATLKLAPMSNVGEGQAEGEVSFSDQKCFSEFMNCWVTFKEHPNFAKTKPDTAASRPPLWL